MSPSLWQTHVISKYIKIITTRTFNNINSSLIYDRSSLMTFRIIWKPTSEPPLSVTPCFSNTQNCHALQLMKKNKKAVSNVVSFPDSHPVPNTSLEGLTFPQSGSWQNCSGFEMRPGVPPPLWSPTRF